MQYNDKCLSPICVIRDTFRQSASKGTALSPKSNEIRFCHPACSGQISTLSRAPLRSGVDHTSEVEDIELYVKAVVLTIPASNARLNSYRLAQEEDVTCNTLISYCRNGWPNKYSLPMYLRSYWKLQGDLSLADNLLLYQNRIVVPEKLQMETLNKLHCGHQGIHRC